MKKALIVATVSDFYVFLKNDIRILTDLGFEVHCAMNFSFDFHKEERIVYHQIDFQRYPFKLSNFRAIKQIRKIIKDNDIKLVHCHTPVGSVIARLAAKRYKKNGCKVIYTAHGLQFYQGAQKKDWILYYPVEKWLSRYADAIITINHEDYESVLKRFHNAKTYYIPGVGIDLSRFCNTVVDRTKIRNELGLCDKDYFLLSVGEINDNKNHQIVIMAIRKTNNPYIKYYIAGEGPIADTLQKRIDSLGLESQIKLLGQRLDIDVLLKCADAFVHPSKREGLSVALMESMAAGLPVVCSSIRGNVDLIDAGQGGFLCRVDSVDDYADAITKLMNNRNLCEQFADYNQKKIQKYSLDVVDEKMRKIYAEILN